jgi:hypothetical protein
MEKKTLPLICAVLLCIILANAGTVDAQTLTIGVYPTSLTVDAPGQLFTIYINITDAPTMDFYDMYNITWNPDVLELETGTEADIVEGPFMKAFGTTITLVQDIEPGRIGDIACGFLTVSFAEGSGNLFEIKFRGKAEGVSDIYIEYAYVLNGSSLVDEFFQEDLPYSTVTVIPEFPASMLLPLFLIATAIAVVTVTVWSRKRRMPI